jgi:hypothetical protein
MFESCRDRQHLILSKADLADAKHSVRQFPPVDDSVGKPRRRIARLIVIAILVAFPSIILWLPSQVGN